MTNPMEGSRTFFVRWVSATQLRLVGFTNIVLHRTSFKDFASLCEHWMLYVMHSNAVYSRSGILSW